MTSTHRRFGLALPLVATALLLAAEASGQTPLVDAARRERARRAAIPPDQKARVYTNDDLRDSGGLTIGILPSPAAVRPRPGRPGLGGPPAEARKRPRASSGPTGASPTTPNGKQPRLAGRTTGAHGSRRRGTRRRERP